MGDYWNKLKRESEEERAWGRRILQSLRARLKAGEIFVCRCGAVTWHRDERIWHVQIYGEPEAFYCPKCLPREHWALIRERKRSFEGAWCEFPDAKQLGMFGEYDPGPTVISRKGRGRG